MQRASLQLTFEELAKSHAEASIAAHLAVAISELLVNVAERDRVAFEAEDLADLLHFMAELDALLTRTNENYCDPVLLQQVKRSCESTVGDVKRKCFQLTASRVDMDINAFKEPGAHNRPTS